MLFLILLAATAAFYYFLVRPYSYWKDRGVKQGKPWILFGDMWGLVFRVMDFTQVVSSQYEKMSDVRYYGVYQFLRPKIVIKDPELIKKITVKDFDHFMDHVAMVDPKADPVFAKNLLGLKGEEWRHMRSTLTGSFTSSKIKIMFNLMAEAADNFVKYFEKQDKKVTDVEMKETFTRFTIDVIASTSFGVQVDSLNEKDNGFFLMGKEITEIGVLAFLKIIVMRISLKTYRFFNFRMFRNEVYDFFGTLVNDTIKTREEKNIHRPDMIQILMEARKGIDKEEANTAEVGFAVTEEFIGKSKIPHNITNSDICSQAMIFFFAGFDSVSSLMTFTTYELAINQDVQDKLREEVLETLAAHNGNVTYEAIVKMKYMDMVLSEVLRKWPPFPTLGRECTKTYVIEPESPNEKRVVIPKGAPVQIPIYGIHHDPKYFPNPEKFDPERFSPENRDNITPYTFLAFGQGPRSCLGTRFALVEVKTVIFYILSRLRIVPTEKTQIPLQLSKKFTVNIRPENGLWLGFEKLSS